MKDHFVLKNMSTDAEIPLIASSVTLGRKDDCEIIVDCSEVSRHHARITVQEGGLTLEDLGSTNGTVLNGRRLRKPEPLNGGDIIVVGQVHYLVIPPGNAGNMTILGGRLGRVDDNYVVDQPDPNMTGLRMPFPKPPGWSEQDDFADVKLAARKPLDILTERLAREPALVEGAAAVLMILSEKNKHTLLPLKDGKQQWTLGRKPGNDVEVSHVTVSSRHAVLTQQAGRWQVEDKQSTNGTRVNRKKIETSPLADGDILRLGKVDLLFKSLPLSD